MVLDANIVEMDEDLLRYFEEQARMEHLYGRYFHKEVSFSRPSGKRVTIHNRKLGRATEISFSRLSGKRVTNYKGKLHKYSQITLIEWDELSNYSYIMINKKGIATVAISVKDQRVRAIPGVSSNRLIAGS